VMYKATGMNMTQTFKFFFTVYRLFDNVGINFHREL
jgi:hypothetical protein